MKEIADILTYNIKNMNPLVSVVLTTYNDEKYIREAIEAVLAQTYNNFEFIIWNDGSTDSTEEIIKTFSDDRIQYFYHENTGVGQALALACKKVKGKYIARIDGDDLCLPNRLEKEVAFLESHTDVVLVSSSVIYINENGYAIGRSFPWTWASSLRKRPSVVQPAAMFRKEAYDKSCGYLNIFSSEDRLLWSRFLKMGKFHNFKTPLIKYRIIASSLSHSIDPKSDYAIMLEIIRSKMCREETIKDEDIKLHNDIYLCAKRHKIETVLKYNPTIEEKLFTLLSAVLGKRISNEIVFFLKNLYMYFQTRAWIN